MIFITGSNGFIGKEVVSILQSKGVKHIAGTRRIYGDIESCQSWDNILKGCTAVIHLAARVHVMNDLAENPVEEFRRVNRDATLALAKAAKLMGVKKFIFVSSIKVNGEETHDKPFRFDDPPAPQDDYAISKFEAEQGLIALNEPEVFDVVIIRPPLVYGQAVGANLKKLMGLAVSGVPLPFRLVNNKRSLVSVKNLADVIVSFCEVHHLRRNIFLVSDSKDVSLKEILIELARAQGRKVFLLPFPVWVMRIFLRLMGQRSIERRLFGNLQVDSADTYHFLNIRPHYNFSSTFYIALIFYKLFSNELHM